MTCATNLALELCMIVTYQCVRQTWSLIRYRWEK